jgi:hypothetical protein
VPLDVFEESDDTNPLHVNYDFTKSEPLSIINDDEGEVKKNPIKHRSYKLKKSNTKNARNTKRRKP